MFLPKRFKSRTQAGELLARRLIGYAYRPDAIVLALPRGGVRVGFALAQQLHVALDVLIVRKLGVPGQEYEAMGAIASGGLRIPGSGAPQDLHVSGRMMDRVAQRELLEIKRREELYRSGRAAQPLGERVVILVDDGLTLASSMHVAVEAVRKENPARIIVAAPVCAPQACEKLRPAVDELICLSTPDPLYAVGMWYQSFSRTTDEEVRRMLNEADRGHVQQSFFQQQR